MSIKRDNVRDHRAGTIDLQAEKNTRKSGFACITLLSGDSFRHLLQNYLNARYRSLRQVYHVFVLGKPLKIIWCIVNKPGDYDLFQIWKLIKRSTNLLSDEKVINPNRMHTRKLRVKLDVFWRIIIDAISIAKVEFCHVVDSPIAASGIQSFEEARKGRGLLVVKQKFSLEIRCFD